MNSIKLKRTLMAIGLGLGMGLSSVVAAGPLEQACASFKQACQNGDSFACERYARACR